jgi:predicted ATPase
VRILATSREPLQLTGEALYPLAGLPVPMADPPGGAADDDPAGSPAVRLFAARAVAVRPDFALDATTAPAVRRICRALDGLPLAIELAAARLRTLPVAVVAERLDDRFTLLSRGSRTAQARHRTLRAVVGWSWDLLDEAEQVLARRLSVFAGGATLPAVARVCGLTGDAAADLLAGLVDRSLAVLATAGTGGPARYRMLDTIRAYGAERLAEAGESGRLDRAHAAYFLELAETADPHLRSAAQIEWLSRVDAERDNLHAAVRWAAGHDTALALRLASALTTYWWLRGRRGEAAELAAAVLAAAGDEPPAGLAEEYAVCVFHAAYGGAHQPARAARLARAKSIVDGLDGPPRQPFLSVLAAVASGPPEDLAARVADSRRRLALDPWSGACVRLGLGLAWQLVGHPDAERELTAAARAGRGLGERWLTVTALAALAEAVEARGDRTRAAALIDEAFDLAAQLDSPDDMADLRCARAEAALRAGDLDAARADFTLALDLARRAGGPETLARARLGLGQSARRWGDLAAARRWCETALAACPLGWFRADEIRAALFVELGRIAQAEGEPGEARTSYERALAIATGYRSAATISQATDGLAAVAGAAGGAAGGAAAAARLPAGVPPPAGGA